MLGVRRDQIAIVSLIDFLVLQRFHELIGFLIVAIALTQHTIDIA